MPSPRSTKSTPLSGHATQICLECEDSIRSCILPDLDIFAMHNEDAGATTSTGGKHGFARHDRGCLDMPWAASWGQAMKNSKGGKILCFGDRSAFAGPGGLFSAFGSNSKGPIFNQATVLNALWDIETLNCTDERNMNRKSILLVVVQYKLAQHDRGN